MVAYNICMRYLGIDYGTKKIGLALSDEAGTMGFPHALMMHTPRTADDLCELILKEKVEAIVMGESRTLAGGKNPVAAGAHELGSLLAARAGVPVFYESEVFSTAEARRAPAKETKSRKPRRRSAVDPSAAALVLTSFLSRMNHG